ncbi:ATP-dependent Zn protease [Calothrix sp. NIES-3974]|uniref:ATP-dependent Zn protease n=1 Tax=Calothrix sp. NIES-3974 TaxID=2005462 RepID=UPI000B61A58D|nr:ATP-dependent Zn protease [Calothrix sp. NIES-3974]BAZ06844.1 hypothetical protein NIES3974_35060 [Calothrix sp. NIES-3974]
MDQLSLNLTAISVFLMTLAILLGPLLHIPPTLPAATTFAVLGVVTVDSFFLQGKGGNVFLDWIGGFFPAYRDRIIYHEAGHFLLAHLFAIPVLGYSLSAWEALQQGFPGQGGVRFDDEEIQNQLKSGKITAQMLDRYGIVWMAGIAAEKMVYTEAQGGKDDRAFLSALMRNVGFSPSICEQKQRFYLLQAKTILEANSLAYTKLVEAMRDRATVDECIRIISESKSMEKLTPLENF